MLMLQICLLAKSCNKIPTSASCVSSSVVSGIVQVAKMMILGTSRLTPIHQVSPAVLSRAACASMMSTTPTTTTTRDREDRYGPMEWAQ